MSEVSEIEPREPRPTCLRCAKPAALCLCDAIPSVANRTGIIILQHRHERFHALGTVRIAALGLERVTVHVVNGADGRGMGHPVRVPPNTGVLYPIDGAVELRDVPSSDRPDNLVVLDGTWSQVKGLYRDNPWLHGLPHFRLSPADPSRYRIRKEPDVHCLSTIESIALALRELEPETRGVDGLVGALDRMVEQQITAHGSAPPTPRWKRVRERRSRHAPAVLLDEPSRVVIVYGESVQRTSRDDERVREMFQWTAVRLGTGEPFEAFVRPARDLPSEHHLGLMEMSSDVCREVADIDTFRARWHSFFADDDVLAAWDRSTLLMYANVFGATAGPIHLKSCYTNLRPGRSGSLAEVLRRESVEPREYGVRGRAARRLGRTVAIAEWIRTRRPVESPFALRAD